MKYLITIGLFYIIQFTYDTRQFGFSLQLPDMTYGLIADSQIERDQWYNTLCKALGTEKFIEENLRH